MTKQWMRVAGLAVGLSLVATLGVVGYKAIQPGQTHLIRSSWAFDQSDKEQVAGYADHIFVGEVVEILRTDDKDGNGVPYTAFSVRVIENLKGSVAETVTVWQLGGTKGKDTWIVEDETAIQVGPTYVLIVKASLNVGGLLVGAGPSSVTELSSSTAGRAVLAEPAVESWLDAIANQRWPDTLSPES